MRALLIRGLRRGAKELRAWPKFLSFWGSEGAKLKIDGVMNIASDQVQTGRFVGEQWDPQLYLAGLPFPHFLSGPALFEVSIETHARALTRPVLYVDFGHGFNDDNAFELIPVKGGRLGALIPDLKGARGLRLDPSEGAVDISIHAPRLRRKKPGDADLVRSADTARALGMDLLPNVLLEGVTVIRVQGLVATEDVCVFTVVDGDPHVLLKNSFMDAAAPLCRYTFKVESLSGMPAAPRLYLDYTGEGFRETSSFALTLRADGLYQAVVVLLGSTPMIRLDPTDYGGRIRLTGIKAEPFSPEHQPSEESPLLFMLSRDLTRKLYGRGDDEGESSDYSDWILRHELSEREAKRVWSSELKSLAVRPLISILVPVYETPAELLTAMIESVRAQVYPHWQLCIADDASQSPHVREIIDGYRAEDERIQAIFRPTNGHISEASNSALELAKGEWLALLDHDDLLTPDALLAVAMEIEAHPGAQFIYSDEDKLDADGARYEAFFKPDFSPELLRSQNYLNHLSVHRAANVRAVGGWRKGFEGSQDYDLNLRILETVDPEEVRHIPKVLYHWRAVEGSTALSNDQKGYAFTAGLRALEEHVRRMGWSADVRKVGEYPFYRVRHALPSPAPMVSLIVPTRDRADLLEVCIRSVLERTTYAPYEILIVDNGSEEPRTFALFQELLKDPRVRLIDQPGPFNYSRINNAAVKESRGEIVGLLNNDIEVISPDWMTEMASWAVQSRIGCVGAKLYYPNDTVQHAGVILGLGGVAAHSHKHRDRGDPGYFGRIAVSHDVSAVTGACLFVRREIWDALDGLDERLAVAFNDVDFCIRVREAGYTNLFTPFAELYHHESVSRGSEDNPEKQARFAAEEEFMQTRWAKHLSLDPFYSPNLTRKRDNYAPR